MPRLPTKEDLGALPSGRSGRHIASYDTSAAGRGKIAAGRAVAQGFNNLGRGIAAGAKKAGVTGSRSGTRRSSSPDPDTVFDVSGFIANETTFYNQLIATAGEDDIEGIDEVWQKGFRDRAAELAKRTPPQFHEYMDLQLVPFEQKRMMDFSSWKIGQWPVVIKTNLENRFKDDWSKRVLQTPVAGPAGYATLKGIEREIDDYLDSSLEHGRVNDFTAQALRRDIMHRVALSYFNALPDDQKDKAIGQSYEPVPMDKVEEDVIGKIRAAGGDAYETAVGLVGAGARPSHSFIDKYVKTGGKMADDATRAWMSAHTNSLLAKAGLKGVGSYVGASLLEHGTIIDPKAAKADGKTLVVLKDRNGGQPYTRFFDGYNPDGSIRTLAPFLVPGKPQSHLQFNQQFSMRLEALLSEARKNGHNVLIQSGFRSVQEQARLYANSDKSGKWVAAPGRSRHNHGIAADLNYGGGGRWGDKGGGAEARKWIHANAGRFGLHFRMGHEPWHIEPMDAAQMGKRTDFPVVTSHTVGSPSGIIVSTAEQEGIDPRIALAIVQIESNFDPHAKNPNSNAYGYYQIIPSTAKGLGIDQKDPWQNAHGGARLTKRNIQGFIRDVGRDPSPGEVYLMHFMGYGGAMKLASRGARTGDATPVSAVMSPGAMRANPFIGKDWTIGDLRKWADDKMATAMNMAGAEVQQVRDNAGDIQILGFRAAPAGVSPERMGETAMMMQASEDLVPGPTFEMESDFLSEHLYGADIQKWISDREKLRKSAEAAKAKAIRDRAEIQREEDRRWKEDPGGQAWETEEFKQWLGGRTLQSPQEIQEAISKLYEIQERRPGMLRKGMAPIPRRDAIRVANMIFTAMKNQPFTDKRGIGVLQEIHRKLETAYGGFTDEVMAYAIGEVLKEKELGKLYTQAYRHLASGRNAAANAALDLVNRRMEEKKGEGIWDAIGDMLGLGDDSPFDRIPEKSLREMAGLLNNKTAREEFVRIFGDQGAEEALEQMDEAVRRAKDKAR